MPALALETLGKRVLNRWWHLGPAHCRRICHAHCKSSTHRIASSSNCLWVNSGVSTAQHLDALWTPYSRPRFWHVGTWSSISNTMSSLCSLMPANANFSPNNRTQRVDRRHRCGQLVAQLHLCFGSGQRIVNCQKNKRGEGIFTAWFRAVHLGCQSRDTWKLVRAQTARRTVYAMTGLPRAPRTCVSTHDVNPLAMRTEMVNTQPQQPC